MRQAPPPITPDRDHRKVESRESIKEARIADVVAARRTLRDERMEAMRRANDPTFPAYGNAEAASDYLAALKDLIMELEPLYHRLGGKEEYWEADEGNPLAVLERPALNVEQLFDPTGALPATGGYPKVMNPEVLEPAVVGTVECLPQLLELDSARISVPVPVRVRRRHTVESETRSVPLTLAVSDLDRARRMCLDYCEHIGLSVATNDERNRGRLAEVGRGDE